MKRALAAIIAAAAFVSAATAAEKIGYGSRVGMSLTIMSADGLDTDRAVIHAVHDRRDAVQFCREYERDKSARCPDKEVKAIPSFTYTANCETGVFVNPNGRYRFVGPLKTPDEDMSRTYQVIDLSTGQDLDGSEASGYPLAMEVFKDLCPSKAPGEIFSQ